MNPNEQQKLYEQQACAHIDAELETIRGDLHLLIDFYSGVKKTRSISCKTHRSR